MSKETEFRYFDAAATMPGGRRRAEQTSSGDVDEQVGLSGVVVKVAAGAGDKCLSPVRSQPKRRQTICNDADGEDTLDVRSVQWTSPAISVSQLATSYQAHCPLLAKVTDHCADFARGQVLAVLNHEDILPWEISASQGKVILDLTVFYEFQWSEQLSLQYVIGTNKNLKVEE